MSEANNRPLGSTTEAKPSADWGKKSGLAVALITLTVIVTLPAVKNLPAAG